MDLVFNMPVSIVTGEKCMEYNANKIAELGKKCLIVTGGGSAKTNGALEDVQRCLTDKQIEFVIFDEILPNPLVGTCKKAGDIAKEQKVDFIIGVGGGSVMDATKAIAVFATNSMKPMDIYNYHWSEKALPFVLVGTTAGTGSEVTPYAVLSSDETNQKHSLVNQQLYAKYAFIDPRYTQTMSRELTIQTLIDALSHSIEAYFSTAADAISDMFALTAIKVLIDNLVFLTDYPEVMLKIEQRKEVLISSIYAGMAINTCGTAYPHALGYFLSEEHNVPHGTACAVFLSDFIMRSKKFMPNKFAVLENVTGMSSIALAAMIDHYNQVDVTLSTEQCKKIAHRFSDSLNFAKSPGSFDEEDAQVLLERIFG